MNWAVSSIIMLVLSALLFIPPTSAEPVLETIESNTDCPAVLNYRFKRLGHEEYQLVCEAYRGKLILVVNTASKCAFTLSMMVLSNFIESIVLLVWLCWASLQMILQVKSQVQRKRS